MDYFEIVLVPQERLGALIGERGKTKRLIEERTGLKIEIDSKTGEVKIKRTGENAGMALKARDTVQAIAHGFPPEEALELLSDDVYFREVDLQGLVRNDRDLVRQRARLIGTKGKARHMLEEYTGTHIRVESKTVSIIGGAQEVELAAEAIGKLATGTPHGDVYKDIQRRQGLI